MPTLARTLRRKTLCLAAAGTALCNIATAAQLEEEEEHLFISEQLVYDDNLFRAAEGSDPGVIPGDPTDPGATPGLVRSREDYSNRITVGIGDDMQFGRHTLKLKGRMHDVRFDENDYLDHTAGDASALFDWRMLSSWSGRLSATYKRTLADFANTLGTAKDLIETTNYNASLRYALGPRWSITANGGRVETEHDLAAREQENLEADLGRISLDYVTPSFHSFGVEYRYVDAKFPNAIPDPTGNSTRDYEENGALARFTYTATVRTQIRLSGGYVERERPGQEEGNYSGDVWRAEIDWKPREKFSTLFAAWRELRAYTDIESDYFVSDGFSVGPTWSPVEKLTFALTVSYEDQEYLASRVVDLGSTDTRNDDLLSGLATLTYRPRENLAFALSYGGSDRDSNRVQRRYDAQTAGLSIRWSVF
jgi:hypothetical protein